MWLDYLHQKEKKSEGQLRTEVGVWLQPHNSTQYTQNPSTHASRRCHRIASHTWSFTSTVLPKWHYYAFTFCSGYASSCIDIIPQTLHTMTETAQNLVRRHTYNETCNFLGTRPIITFLLRSFKPWPIYSLSQRGHPKFLICWQRFNRIPSKCIFTLELARILHDSLSVWSISGRVPCDRLLGLSPLFIIDRQLS